MFVRKVYRQGPGSMVVTVPEVIQQILAVQNEGWVEWGVKTKKDGELEVVISPIRGGQNRQKEGVDAYESGKSAN